MKRSGAIRKCSLNNFPTVSDCGAQIHFSLWQFFLSFFSIDLYIDLTHDIIFSHYFSSHVIRSLMICRTLVACNANVCINILWEIKTTDWMSRWDFKCFASKNLFIFYYFRLPYLSQILDIRMHTERNNKANNIGLFKCLQGFVILIIITMQMDLLGILLHLLHICKTTKIVNGSINENTHAKVRLSVIVYRFFKI